MPLLLASRSPRRAALLRDAGYRFEQAEPPFADPHAPVSNGQSPQQLAAELALQKAISVPPTSAVILAADTICVGVDGQLIGTPQTRDEARTMIASFVNRAHDVVTGIALRDDVRSPMTLHDTASVVFGQVNDAQIEAYLDTDQWRGKAGGYNLFDRQADGWPIEVQGDPATVVGLPMQKLGPALAAFGVQPG